MKGDGTWMTRPRFWWLALLCVPAFVCGFALPSHSASQQENLSAIKQARALVKQRDLVGADGVLTSALLQQGQDTTQARAMLELARVKNRRGLFADAEGILKQIITSENPLAVEPGILSGAFRQTNLSLARQGKFSEVRANMDEEIRRFSYGQNEDANLRENFKQFLTEEETKDTVVREILPIISEMASAMERRDSSVIERLFATDSIHKAEAVEMINKFDTIDVEVRVVDVSMEGDTIAALTTRTKVETSPPFVHQGQERHNLVVLTKVGTQWKIESF